MHNAIITLADTVDSGKGRAFKSRFIQAGIAGYPNQFGNVLITKESLDKFIKTMVGVPVIINHKDLSTENVDDERVGVVSNVWYDDKDGWYWCDGIIWDETAINLIKDKKWSVSCSYNVLKADDEGGTENNIEYDMEFLDGVFTHLAIVNNPRYERANIVVNSKTEIVNYKPEQKRDEFGKWVKDEQVIQKKKDSLKPIEVKADELPQFETKKDLGEWFSGIFKDLGDVTIDDTGIKIDLYPSNANREAFKRRFQQEPNKAVAKAFEEIITGAIKVDERQADERHKHDQEIYYNKLKLGTDDYNVNLFVDYLKLNDEYRYAGHSTTKIDNKKTTRDTQVINHIMLTKVDNNIINDDVENFNPEDNEMLSIDNDKWITKFDKEGEPYHFKLDDDDEKDGKKKDKTGKINTYKQALIKERKAFIEAAKEDIRKVLEHNENLFKAIKDYSSDIKKMEKEDSEKYFNRIQQSYEGINNFLKQVDKNFQKVSELEKEIATYKEDLTEILKMPNIVSNSIPNSLEQVIKAYLETNSITKQDYMVLQGLEEIISKKS